MNQKLNKERVNVTYYFCLFNERKDTGSKAIDGITLHPNFSVEKIRNFEAEIREMLSEMPEIFFNDPGNTILEGSEDKYGEQWASEMEDIEKLLVLGMAAGLVTCSPERELWIKLPGGMPFFTISLNK